MIVIYNVIWLNIIPGVREKALAHLQELAQIAQGEHNASSRVFVGVTTGPLYQTALVTAHENMASMVNTIDALAQSESFQAWFGEATELFNWSAAEWQTFRALRAPNESFSSFIHVVAMHITPGKLMAGREQMGKFADHVEATYGRPVHLLHHEGGMHYRHWLVVGYDSMAQYEEVQAALANDAVYGQWAMDVLEVIDARTIETNIGRYL